jgi:hypothetical protein
MLYFDSSITLFQSFIFDPGSTISVYLKIILSPSIRNYYFCSFIRYDIADPGIGPIF